VVSANESYLEVGAFYDLSDEPLELVTPASPNVLVLQDASNSLNLDIMTEEVDGYYPLGPKSPYDNIYSIPGRETAPKESAEPDYGFWRLRSKDYNKIYYNPEVQYEPWARCDGTADAPGGCISGNDLDPPAADLYYYYVWDDKLEADCPSGNEGEVDSLPSPSTDPTDACTEGYLVSIKSETETGTQGAASSLASLRDFTPTNYDDGNALYPKFPNRNDCASDTHCTLAEEQANFENYYVWYRTRGFAMKASIGKVMSEADQNLRVGFAGSNGNNNDVEIRALNAAQGADTQINLLLTGLYDRSYQGQTPQFYDAFDKSGKYLACQKTNVMNVAQGGNPTDGDDFNSPGCPVLPAPQGTCQQNYILLVTDGGYGGAARGGEHDNDGVSEPPTSDFDGAMFAGCATCLDTLADIAMYYYERDLFNGEKDGYKATMELANDVVPLQRDLDYAPAGAISGSAMHQHIKTFVVAFGIDSGLTDVPASYQAEAYDWGAPEDANFKIKDLHHAAVNGRGAYLDAQNPAGLTSALEQAFSEFSSGIGAGSAVSFNSQEISNGVVLFRSFYNLLENTGDVVASTLNADLTVGAQLWSTAAQLDVQLGAGGSGRQIVTFDPGTNRGQAFALGTLTTAQKQPLGWIDSSSDAEVTLKIDYLRGSSANERPTGDFRARPTEDGRLGDIINSSPVFVGPPEALFRGGAAYPTGANSYAAFQVAQSSRADRLYVSANDGMLHSIDPTNGNEVFAFIPNATLVNSANTNISELIEPSYSHQYILDATPVVDDVYMTGKQSSKGWRTVLLGAFGAGGKGLFALDVTNPAISESAVSDKVLWEFTDLDDTYPTDSAGNAITTGAAQRVDGSGLPIKDLGLSIDEPVIAMSNVYVAADDTDLEWIGLLSNGLNSTSGIAKLFGLFIDRGADGTWCHPDSRFDDFSDTSAGYRGSCHGADYDFIKIDTGEGGYSLSGSIYPNGLGAPRAIDADTDGTVDYVYAGDIKGNLWRFDLCRADLEAWEIGDSLSQYEGAVGACKKGGKFTKHGEPQRYLPPTIRVAGPPPVNRF
jgi:type IV pilus assembly protein PilY1